MENIIAEVKKINADIKRKTNFTDYKINWLKNVFKDDSDHCVICGYYLSQTANDQLNREYHAKNVDNDHEFLPSIELFVSDFFDESLLYGTTYGHGQEEIIEGIAIRESSLVWLEVTKWTNTELENTEITKNFGDLPRKKQKWVLNNLDKFLESYLIYCKETEGESNDLLKLTDEKIDKIIQVLKT